MSFFQWWGGSEKQINSWCLTDDAKSPCCLVPASFICDNPALYPLRRLRHQLASLAPSDLSWKLWEGTWQFLKNILRVRNKRWKTVPWPAASLSRTNAFLNSTAMSHSQRCIDCRWCLHYRRPKHRPCLSLVTSKDHWRGIVSHTGQPCFLGFAFSRISSVHLSAANRNHVKCWRFPYIQAQHFPRCNSAFLPAVCV